MAKPSPIFTRLTSYETLTLAAVAEFCALCGLDARAEVRRRLAELRERRRQRWVEEWVIGLSEHGRENE